LPEFPIGYIYYIKGEAKTDKIIIIIIIIIIIQAL
jgi:hypothetical protein